MTSSYQETELSQEIQDVEESGFDSAAVHHNLNSTTTTLETCTSCGSTKRRSPSSSSFFREPSPKRATLYPPPSSTTMPSTSPPLLPSPPPPSSSNATHPNNLHRSLSETSALTQLTNSQSPEYLSENNADISASASPSTGAVGASLALPPLPRATLWRSLSDPTSSQFQPRPQPARRTLLRSPTSDQESRESKSLKKIMQKLKEMSQWVENVMSEEDEADTHSEEDNCNINCNINSNSKQDASENGAEAQPEEAVWVEKRNGEGLGLHFRCPCSNDYEIFLSGNTCYYRLM